MWYAKNVPSVERALRVLGGLGLIACGWVMKGSLTGYLLMAAGAVAIVTGFVGFCPVCALAGRRIARSVKAREENL